MQEFQREFLDFAIHHQVIRFGEFVLKSGRVSPYFFNAGLFSSGEKLARLGEYYAAAIINSGIAFDMLYGPAYKGIPLAAATAIGLSNNHQRDVPFCFNRKEAKKHAEGGILVGAPLSGRVLIIDDVISSGMSVREAVDIIRLHGGEPVGVAIALDRQERGEGQTSAVNEIESEFGLQVISIACLQILERYLEDDIELKQYLPAIQAYRQQYGI